MSRTDTTPERPQGILSGLRAHFGRLGRDRKGVAAIEFAFIAPLLLVTYFMTMEVSQGLEVSKKTGRIAIIVGDLVTQQQSLNKADLDSIMRIGEAVIQPYSRSAPSVYVTAIEISDEEKPKATVAWSRKLVGGATSSYLPAGSIVTTVPQKLMIRNTFLIRAESKLEYTPVVVWSAGDSASFGMKSAFDKLDMSDRYFLRPRMSQKVGCNDC
ncbi:pilus assembly protein [Aquibium carbonis]|uniref:Pilus assembly protein n=1 Tax=Aquibium carbonis TaxID=2495581 RepID=A0A429Z1B7_9HYPH|nr:TadE/TadG family type IV pilus assembly protein [Aquibium carbonis]RST87501.1 pilus assembly protein [Aquibium carbonis]